MFTINPTVFRCIEGKLALLCESMVEGVLVDLMWKGRAIHFTVRSVECMRYGSQPLPGAFYVTITACECDVEVPVVDLLVAGVQLRNKQRV